MNQRLRSFCAFTLASSLLLSGAALAGDPKDEGYLPEDGEAVSASEDAASALRNGGQGAATLPSGTVTDEKSADVSNVSEVTEPEAAAAPAASGVAAEAATSSAAAESAAQASTQTTTTTALSDNPNVVIDAVIAHGAPILQDVVSYRVERLEAGVPKEVVANYSGQEAALDLPQGRYRVTATYGETIVQDDIVISSATSSHTVNLNAGYIDLKVIPHIGGDPVATPIDWKILTFGKNYQGKRELLHELPGNPRPFVVLPAGWYIVQAWEGDKLTKHAIEVVPGATLKYTLIRQ